MTALPLRAGVDTPFARMTGIKLSDQPDLLAGDWRPTRRLWPICRMPRSRRPTAAGACATGLLAGGVLVIALGAFWMLSGGGEVRQRAGAGDHR